MLRKHSESVTYFTFQDFDGSLETESVMFSVSDFSKKSVQVPK